MKPDQRGVSMPTKVPYKPDVHVSVRISVHVAVAGANEQDTNHFKRTVVLRFS